ncbi:MAG: glycosyltransferase family 2 protein [Chthoniobacterales bacterium]
MSTSSTQIAAVVVTFRRDPELVRLLQSLEASTRQPTLIVIVDNAASAATETVVAESSLNTFYMASPDNPGPGTGWKRGMQAALVRLPGTTHFLVLDDDVVLPVEAIEKLVQASAKAVITCPMLLDSNAKIWAFPEPKKVQLRKKIRQVQSASDSTQLLGKEPLPFVWCTGACLLVRRDAVDAAGFYRTDFWMLGEDLEYSMRLAAFGGGLFLPDVFVIHLPPIATEPAAASHRKKFDSLLQNLAYLSFHHPSSDHLMSYLPGNARRYFRTFGWNLASLTRIVVCLWKGAISGKPAGVK